MIGLVTVNYNQYKMTEDFLESLSSIKKPEQLIVFIADVSTKKEEFKLKKYPFKLKIVSLPNRGYAFGINEGVKYFLKNNIDKFCAINNDITFDNNFVIASENGFEKADIFGGKIYYAPGYEYHKKYEKKEKGRVIWYAGGITDWKNAMTFHRGVDQVDRGQYEQFIETEFITGCMLFFNKKIIDQVGFWDEKYFLYYEDADFCERAKKSGFELYYNPEIVIYHKNSQSTGGSGSPLQAHYQRKNQLKYGLKYAPLRTKLHLIKNYLIKK